MSARQDAEMSMMNPEMSRMDRTFQQPVQIDTTEQGAAESPAGEGEEPGAEDGATPVEGEGAGEEGAEGSPETAKPEKPIPILPTFDKYAMEDLAPAERLRIQ